MKFLHISDIHIGKRMNNFSMIEDQKYILNEIINIIKNESIEAVIIAGDIYDKSVPQVEAVQIFDNFISKLSKKSIKVFIISGNHDSTERISFGWSIMNKSDIYISPIYTGKIEPISIKDNFGKINIFMLPFIKPSNVRLYFDDVEINSYNDMMKFIVNNIDINKSERNIIILHQFITGAIRTDSEDIIVGGIDNIDFEIFNDFDYVALGHIHKAQYIKKNTIRYCGTPLKYSLSEINDNKSVTIFDLKDKNNIDIYTVPLKPKRDLIEISGKFSEITSNDFISNINTDNYIYVTLEDEHDIIDGINKLRKIYPNIMKLEYNNIRTRNKSNIESIENTNCKRPIEFFQELYKSQNGQDMCDEQIKFISEIIDEIWEENI